MCVTEREVCMLCVCACVMCVWVSVCSVTVCVCVCVFVGMFSVRNRNPVRHNIVEYFCHSIFRAMARRCSAFNQRAGRAAAQQCRRLGNLIVNGTPAVGLWPFCPQHSKYKLSHNYWSFVRVTLKYYIGYLKVGRRLPPYEFLKEKWQMDKM